MLTIRALIVDDEPLARDRLRGLLAAEPGFEAIGECASEIEALAAIRRENPDLVFLDLHLSGGDGRQVLARLPEDRRPAIVVATAHEEFARTAFDFAVVDYLLKPFDQERFRQALRRVKHYLRTSPGSPPSRPERLTVKTDGRLIFLRTEEIVRLEADDNLVTLHLRDRCLVVRETLGALEARLDPGSFVRVNRSTLVNVDQIREIISEPVAESAVILRDGTKLPLGRGLRAQFDSFSGSAG